MKKLFHTVAASAATFSLVLASLGATASAALADGGASAPAADRDHKAGVASSSPTLPADTKVPAGSPAAKPGAQPDANGMVPHICAGRKILYKAHVDAVYATRFNGELRLTTVDGSHVMDHASDACLRLAPDANARGQEVSRIVVPNNPLYSFLGAPGTILWNAPVENNDGEGRPIWAGFGAFDSEHEVSLPRDIYLDKVAMKMVNVDGPGFLEVWVASSRVIHSFSSRGYALPETIVDVNTHAHTNWTFSKPGVYKLGFQASTRDLNTQKVTTTPVTQYVWLVGSDEEVGLPAGFTKGTRTITTSAEQRRTAMGLSDPGDAPTSGTGSNTPAPTGPVAPPELQDGQLDRELQLTFYSKDSVPQKIYSSGTLMLTGSNNEGGSGLQANWWDVDAKAIASPMWQDYVLPLAVEVPDASLSCIPRTEGTARLYNKTKGGWLWRLPATPTPGQVTLGWDSRQMHFDNFRGPLRIDDNGMAASQDSLGAVVSWTGEGPTLASNIEISTDGSGYNLIPMSKPEAITRDVVFTRPGLYSISTAFKAEFNKPVGDLKQDYAAGGRVYAVVGNKAINQVRQWKYEADVAAAEREGRDASTVPQPQLLPEGQYPTCKYVNGEIPSTPSQPSDPSHPGTPSDPSQPADPTHPDDPTQPADGAVPSVSAEKAAETVASVFGDHARALIRNGHIDHMLRLNGEAPTGEVFAHWTHGTDPEKYYRSGEFTYAVPNSQYLDHLDPLTVGAAFPEAFMHGAFFLPQVQDPAVPWPGFSTNHTDPAFVQDGSKVTLSLENVVGPGRLVMGTAGTFGGFSKWLDSAAPNETYEFPVNNHAHPATYFSAPGLYTADIVFTFVDKQGQTQRRVLNASWAVGDETVKAVADYEAAHGQPSSQPGDGGSTPAEPGSDPSQPAQPGGASTSDDQAVIDALVASLNDASGAAQAIRDQHAAGGAGAGSDKPGSDKPGSGTPGSDQPGSGTPGSDQPGSSAPADAPTSAPAAPTAPTTPADPAAPSTSTPGSGAAVPAAGVVAPSLDGVTIGTGLPSGSGDIAATLPLPASADSGLPAAPAAGAPGANAPASNDVAAAPAPASNDAGLPATSHHEGGTKAITGAKAPADGATTSAAGAQQVASSTSPLPWILVGAMGMALIFSIGLLIAARRK